MSTAAEQQYKDGGLRMLKRLENHYLNPAKRITHATDGTLVYVFYETKYEGDDKWVLEQSATRGEL